MCQRFLLQCISFFAILFYLLVPVRANAISLQKQLEQIEHRYQKTIGVAALNLGNHQSIEYRAKESFPIQGTFKTLLVAFILKQNMDHPGLLKQRLAIKRADIVTWSPVTEKKMGQEMSIKELCQATIRYSDNTAANLLLKYSGGPKALTAFLRSTGDSTSRIEHWEPSLNSNPDKPEDSSTPEEMKDALVKILHADFLGQKETDQLLDWMKSNTTGSHRIRSGIAPGWIVADKTGAGAYGIANDIAIVWPPHCKPIVLAVFTYGKKKEALSNDQMFAEVTHCLMEHFAANDPCFRLG